MNYHTLLIFVLLKVCFVKGISQENKKLYENLVFEGAGIRGIGYAGALDELEKNGLLKNIKRTGGTSAGAVIALAYSINYTPQEIKQVIGNTNFRKFNDGRFFFIGGLFRLNKNFGWYNGKEIENSLALMIERKTGNADITFGEMHSLGYKDLYVTGTDLTNQKAVIFSYEHTPDMKIRDAVRISVAIPLYFRPLLLDDQNKVHNKRNASVPLRVIVDGGIIENFPVRLFDSTKYVQPNATNTFFYNPRTLAFRIDTEEQILNDRTTGKLAPAAITNLRAFIKAFYTMVLESLNRTALTHEDWIRTVSINDANIGPRVRKLRRKEIEQMVEFGRQGVKTYLQTQ